MSEMRATRLIQITVLCAAQLLVACAPEQLTEQSVRKFVDAADQAFLKGNARQVCEMRSSAFVLSATEFKPAHDRMVSGLDEAMKIAEQRKEAGELLSGKTATLNLREFCAMAYEAREFYKRATLERGDLTIVIDASGNQATVRAHYTVKEPVYAYGDSPLSMQDQVEHQVATKQSESDDESVVAMEEGQMRFVSTKSVTQSFRVAAERDERY